MERHESRSSWRDGGGRVRVKGIGRGKAKSMKASGTDDAALRRADEEPSVLSGARGVKDGREDRRQNIGKWILLVIDAGDDDVEEWMDLNRRMDEC